MIAVGTSADRIQKEGGRNCATLCATAWTTLSQKSGFTMGTADRKPAH